MKQKLTWLDPKVSLLEEASGKKANFENYT